MMEKLVFLHYANVELQQLVQLIKSVQKIVVLAYVPQLAPLEKLVIEEYVNVAHQYAQKMKHVPMDHAYVVELLVVILKLAMLHLLV
jgi:hypothetical protein